MHAIILFLFLDVELHVLLEFKFLNCKPGKKNLELFATDQQILKYFLKI